jgi:cysteine-rich repeat protein
MVIFAPEKHRLRARFDGHGPFASGGDSAGMPPSRSGLNDGSVMPFAAVTDCGNGVLNAGEECDDGHVSPAACCARIAVRQRRRAARLREPLRHGAPRQRGG